jgi:succinate dehydrogenase / fumarate reductase, flavoprotein subunit
MTTINREMHTTDILIMGGGLAGLVAAIVAREKGWDVLVIDKSMPGWAGQVPVSGGNSMAIPPEDDMNEFVKWAVEEGGYLNDQSWTDLFGRRSYPDTMKLTEWGVKLPFRDSRLQVMPKMKGYKSIQFAADTFMLQLRKAALQKGVKILDKIHLGRLLMDGDRVAGAGGIGLVDGKHHVIRARTVLMAIGSCRYKRQKTFTMNSGEGVVMAFRAGARLRNAEFSNTYGYCLKGFEAYRRDPVYYFFVNRLGERVVEKHFPEFKAALIDKREVQDFAKICEAMAQEVMEGNGPIFMDLSLATKEERDFMASRSPDTVSPSLKSKTTSIWMVPARKAGIDIFREKLEVIPMFVGGQGPVEVDEECRTTVPGLWAAGDACALGCGWSGARSPGTTPGVGIPFAIVSGIIAGASMGDRAGDLKGPGSVTEGELRRVEGEMFGPLQRVNGRSHREIIQKVHEAVVPMKYNFFRTEGRLMEALRLLEEVEMELGEARAENPHVLAKLIEAEGMALSGMLTYTAALERKETRGTQKRQDFPERDDQNWLKWIILTQDASGKPQVSYEEIPFARYRFHPTPADGR